MGQAGELGTGSPASLTCHHATAPIIATTPVRALAATSRARGPAGRPRTGRGRALLLSIVRSSRRRRCASASVLDLCWRRRFARAPSGQPGAGWSRSDANSDRRTSRSTSAVAISWLELVHRDSPGAGSAGAWSPPSGVAGADLRRSWYQPGSSPNQFPSPSKFPQVMMSPASVQDPPCCSVVPPVRLDLQPRRVGPGGGVASSRGEMPERGWATHTRRCGGAGVGLVGQVQPVARAVSGAPTRPLRLPRFSMRWPADVLAVGGRPELMAATGRRSIAGLWPIVRAAVVRTGSVLSPASRVRGTVPPRVPHGLVQLPGRRVQPGPCVRSAANAPAARVAANGSPAAPAPVTTMERTVRSALRATR